MINLVHFRFHLQIQNFKLMRKFNCRNCGTDSGAVIKLKNITRFKILTQKTTYYQCGTAKRIVHSSGILGKYSFIVALFSNDSFHTDQVIFENTDL